MPLDFSSENKIFHHPGQEQMQVEVILASVSAERPDDKPLVTMRLRYPRIIHGEIMTHRVFSRNARSSRAVPVKTMLNETTSIPFIPWHWGKNQKGMQADEECNAIVQSLFLGSDSNGDGWYRAEDIADVYAHTTTAYRETAWLNARDAAVLHAKAFMEAGYHKQLPNRLLEPFSWIDVLITSNQWDNFLWLRDHKDAEPHLQDLARLVGRALDEMKVNELGYSHWHLPYITEADSKAAIQYLQNGRVTRDMPSPQDAYKWLCKISAARCARISYKPFDGDTTYERELERYDMLVTSERVHASPTEHQARPDHYSEEYGGWDNQQSHGNLHGWVQARKLIPNEAHNG